MKTAMNVQQELSLTANPRFWDRLLTASSVVLLAILASAVWVKVQDSQTGVFAGTPIEIEIRTPTVAPAAPPTEVASAPNR